MTKVLFVLFNGKRGQSTSFNYLEDGKAINLKLKDGEIYHLPEHVIDKINKIGFYSHESDKQIDRCRMYKVDEPVTSALDAAQAILDDPTGVTYGLRACRAIEKIIEYLKAKDKE